MPPESHTRYSASPNGSRLVLEGGRVLASEFFSNGSHVVRSRKTGWGVPTGTASRSAFDTTTVTTAQLAARVKALLDDLSSHGLIGT